jgi:predicted nucleic acid-binding protein
MSTQSSIKIQRLGTGQTSDRALIDTSVALVLTTIDPDRLPGDIAISALTLAELTTGPYAAQSAAERARREDNLQRIETSIQCLAFDAACSPAYSRIYAATLEIGRKPRGARAVDLMIAAVARANELPLYTLNGADFAGLDGLVEVVDLG